ncbi:hypothetical protein TNCV_4199571 [Trichonephila clavipes]|uniref:Uncharacterized protein n=1 Tax=Trichonephila clavipes TaxID=2585209 RepID=A0A8X6WCM7_TRICX|nr:hypothetical protein TNCV_4199571 [Trichonephila clavipes]
MRVWKQWTDEHLTRKTSNGRRKVMSVRDHRHLLHMAVKDRTVASRRYAGERCLPECVIERHSGLTPGVMVWGAISYHRRSNFLRIEVNFISNRCTREVLQPEIIPFL